MEIAPTILLFRTGVEFGFIRYPNKKILLASIIQPIITFSVVFFSLKSYLICTFLRHLPFQQS